MTPYATHLLVRNRPTAIVPAIVLMCLAAVPQYVVAQQERSSISVQTTDGKTLSGELVALDGQFLEVVTNGENQTLAFEHVESVSIAEVNSQMRSASLQCRLADGSVFNATKLSVSGAQATLTLASGVTVALARTSLKSTLLFDAVNELEKLGQWDQFLQDFSATSDAIVAEKNEALQAIEGIVADVDEEGFDFQIGDRQVTVKTEKLTGVVFYRAAREFPNSVCEVRLTDQSSVGAAQIELVEGGLSVVTGTGDRLVFPVEVVAELNLSAGRAIYLSDLLPTTNDWKPLVASKSNLDNLLKLNLSVANESFFGQPLSLRSVAGDGLNFLATTQTYDKGFAIGGGGRLAFNLNGQFKRLTALAGFDPELQSLQGTVEVEIQVDSRTALSAVLENRQLTQPLPIDIDVADAKRLIIRVNYQDGRSVGDRIHLVDARLSR